MDVDTVFRARFGIKKQMDIIGLIEAAVSVAALIVPEKLKKHRSRIVKLLFDEDRSTFDDLFSDDELLDSDEDEDEVKVAVSSPQPNLETETKKGFKKAVELCVEVPPTPEKMMELKVEATKKMLGDKYREEAEKKAKRKIKCLDDVDFPQPKKVKKAPGGDVRQRIVSRMKRMKAENAVGSQSEKGDGTRGWTVFAMISCVFVKIPILFSFLHMTNNDILRFIVASTLLCCGGFIYNTRVQNQHGRDALPGMAYLSACLETLGGVSHSYTQPEDANRSFENQVSWEQNSDSTQVTWRTTERTYGSV